jgi:hypothetical protein
LILLQFPVTAVPRRSFAFPDRWRSGGDTAIA